MNRLLILLLTAILTACATLHEPLPPDFKGPIVKVTDTGRTEDRSKAQFFVLQEVDGKTVNNSIFESRKVSHGRGFALTTIYITRGLPATPMKVKLLGTHQTAAPIHEIASRAAGTFFSVEGVVDFNPIAGREYIVKGELSKESSTVWIEDAATNDPVTVKVQAKR
jgi:hypothetical protein